MEYESFPLITRSGETEPSYRRSTLSTVGVGEFTPRILHQDILAKILHTYLTDGSPTQKLK